jgi:hypothetical protein
MSPAIGFALLLLLPTALLAAGAAWQDCIPIALAAAAAHRLFLWRMDRGAPWEGWRAALRCVVAGAAGLAAAVVLAGFVAGGLLGAWPMRHDHTLAMVGLAALGALGLSAAQPDARRRRAEALFWTLLLGSAALAQVAGEAGLGIWPCLYTLAVAAGLAHAGWGLAHGQARRLLDAGQRR